LKGKAADALSFSVRRLAEAVFKGERAKRVRMRGQEAKGGLKRRQRERPYSSELFDSGLAQATHAFCSHPGEPPEVNRRTTTNKENMKKVLCSLLLVLISCSVTLAQDKPLDELRRMFDYDRKASLDVKEVGVISRDGVRVRDITYVSPKGGRVTAYLVEPVRKGRFAGIVFGHWGYGTRTEFLPEAILYARAGAISLLVDDPEVRPAPWRRSSPGTEPEAVRDNFIQSVVDLQRGIDLLSARPGVDADRIAYVGHSSGARWGAILSAIDKRIRTAILMAGVPTEATIYLESEDPDFVEFRNSTPKEQRDKYIQTVSPLDAIRYVPYAAPTPLLFQFARFERYFNEAAMLRYARAASEPKEVKWYDTGHELNDIQALKDRADWLRKQIGIKVSTIN
jgi:dienelactone hydrolase